LYLFCVRQEELVDVVLIVQGHLHVQVVTLRKVASICNDMIGTVGTKYNFNPIMNSANKAPLPLRRSPESGTGLPSSYNQEINQRKKSTKNSYIIL
jgi:hypothetical protein